ncbi:RidA family protein [Patescibacteria group bacterium]|nr:RidA family protein [Patescibacteria group bacterium]MBU1682571.1 RidA family protein [Patescibacteria group bacterium]MBU1935095.1 RidA family protein [Patescibacteria group bacterium]
MSKQIISTINAPEAIGPYSQAVVHDEIVYCSGQIALNPETMETVGKTAAEQAKQVMENLKSVLEEAGSNLEKVLKCTVYVKDLNDFTAVNEIYGSYFPENPPARVTVEVSRLPKDVLVEIDCIAYL